MVSSFELILHLLLLGFAVATPGLIFLAYLNFKKSELKNIVGYYCIAFFFSALRWAGGSLSRLNFEFTHSSIYVLLWTLTGIFAAVFGLYACKKLLEFAAAARNK